MPIKENAKKALRQSIKRHARNVAVKENIKKLIKVTKKSVAAKKIEDAAVALKNVGKALDKAVQKKILKKNTAARLKSRLAGHVNALSKK